MTRAPGSTSGARPFCDSMLIFQLAHDRSLVLLASQAEGVQLASIDERTRPPTCLETITDPEAV